VNGWDDTMLTWYYPNIKRVIVYSLGFIMSAKGVALNQKVGTGASAKK